MTVEVLPKDEPNLELLANLHPSGWRNPEPAPRYNLVVLGAGTAGLVSAAAAAQLGATVALVEESLLGGDCLVTGCVPSKTVLRSSRFYADLRHAGTFGARAPQQVVADSVFAMEHMRRIRARISRQDSVRRFQEMGVHVFLGAGRFTGPDSLEVDGRTLRFRKAVIATGARPHLPQIEGLTAAGYLTNETLFNLVELPRRLLVIGGGPLGCEMAQAFRRLGSEVTIVQQEPLFLPREERDAAQILAESFEQDGMRLRLGTRVERVSRSGSEKIAQLVVECNKETIAVDEILTGTGRVPSVDGMGLEDAGVRYDENGIAVDDYLQTTNRRIYAAGDVCLETKFTHMADATARIAVRNALFLGRRRLSALTVPWCTYTDPEIAHVGLYVREARARDIPVKTFTIPFSDVDRAITDGEEKGFVKITVREGTDRIVGATVVGRHAGEIISEITLAIVARIGLGRLADVIHPYPTQAEAIRKAADAYNRTRLTPRIKAWSVKWLAWTR